MAKLIAIVREPMIRAALVRSANSAIEVRGTPLTDVMYELRNVDRHLGIIIAGVPGTQFLSCILLASLFLTNEKPNSGSFPVVGTSNYYSIVDRVRRE